MPNSLRLGLVAVFLLGLVMRFYHLGAAPLAGDETVSIGCATGVYINYALLDPAAASESRFLAQCSGALVHQSFQGVLAMTARDNGNMALFHLMLFCWFQLFPVTRLGARLLPASLDTLGLACAAWMVSRTGLSRAQKILFVLLLAVHPLSLALARNTRSYCMATVLVVFLGVSLQKFVEAWKVEGSSRFAPSVLLLSNFLGLCFCHYLSVYVIVAGFIWLLLSRAPRKTCFAYAGLGALSALCLAYWMLAGTGSQGTQNIVAVNQSYTVRAASTQPGSWTMPLTPRTLAGGTTQSMLAVFGNGLRAAFSLSRLFPLMALPLVAILSGWISRDSRVRGVLRLCVCVVVAGWLQAVVLCLLSGHIVAFQPLYQQFSSAAGVLLLAVALVHFYERNRLAGLVLGLLQLLITLSSLYFCLPAA